MRLAKAQTLIEMLAALAVISVGLLAAITLVYSNLNLVERDADETVSVNLAREGVELAKSIRDSNWLAGYAFDMGLANPTNTDYTATPVWNGVAGNVYFDFTADDFTNDNAKIVTTPTPASPNFYANFDTAAAVSGTSTAFLRLLTFHPICDDYTVLDSGSVCSPKYKIGVRVESHIRWLRKGITKDQTIYEDLYDWR